MADEIRDGKETIIKALTSENIDTSRLSDEELDNLIGKLAKPDVVSVVECVKNANGTEEDIVEALHRHLGFKVEEAKVVYNDSIQERTENELDEIIKALS